MSRETKAAKLARTAEIIGRLRQTYPDAHCELDFSNPLELLVLPLVFAQMPFGQFFDSTRTNLIE